MEREARHAWFAEADKLAHAEGVRGDSSQPFRLRRVARTNQGLRSFHSLNPWLLSVHPSGVLIHALMRLQIPMCKTIGRTCRLTSDFSGFR